MLSLLCQGHSSILGAQSKGFGLESANQTKLLFFCMFLDMYNIIWILQCCLIKVPIQLIKRKDATQHIGKHTVDAISVEQGDHDQGKQLWMMRNSCTCHGHDKPVWLDQMMHNT